jgi:hypothetical protein
VGVSSGLEGLFRLLSLIPAMVAYPEGAERNQPTMNTPPLALSLLYQANRLYRESGHSIGDRREAFCRDSSLLFVLGLLNADGVPFDKAIDYVIGLENDGELTSDGLLFFSDGHFMQIMNTALAALSAWMECRGQHEGVVWESLTPETIKRTIEVRNAEWRPMRGPKRPLPSSSTQDSR